MCDGTSSNQKFAPAGAFPPTRHCAWARHALADLRSGKKLTRKAAPATKAFRANGARSRGGGQVHLIGRSLRRRGDAGFCKSQSVAGVTNSLVQNSWSFTAMAKTADQGLASTYPYPGRPASWRRMRSICSPPASVSPATTHRASSRNCVTKPQPVPHGEFEILHSDPRWPRGDPPSDM